MTPPPPAAAQQRGGGSPGASLQSQLPSCGRPPTTLSTWPKGRWWQARMVTAAAGAPGCCCGAAAASSSAPPLKARTCTAVGEGGAGGGRGQGVGGWEDVRPAAGGGRQVRRTRRRAPAGRRRVGRRARGWLRPPQAPPQCPAAMWQAPGPRPSLPGLGCARGGAVGGVSARRPAPWLLQRGGAAQGTSARSACDTRWAGWAAGPWSGGIQGAHPQGTAGGPPRPAGGSAPAPACLGSALGLVAGFERAHESGWAEQRDRRPYPCWDPQMGHRRPTNAVECRGRRIARIRASIRGCRPGAPCRPHMCDYGPPRHPHGLQTHLQAAD